MKKTLKLVVIAMAVVAMGGVTTSCSEDSPLLNIIRNLFNPGETYEYTGSATSQTSNIVIQDNKYAIGTAVNAKTENPEGAYVFSSMPVSLTTQNNVATITLPVYEEGVVKVSQLSMGNLTLTTNDEQTNTVLGIGDDGFTRSGTLTYNGKEYVFESLWINKANATTTSLELDLQLYFKASDESDYSLILCFTYQGTREATE